MADVVRVEGGRERVEQRAGYRRWRRIKQASSNQKRRCVMREALMEGRERVDVHLWQRVAAEQRKAEQRSAAQQQDVTKAGPASGRAPAASTLHPSASAR